MRIIEIQMINRIINNKPGLCGNNTFVDFVPVAGAMGNNPDVTCASVTLYETEIARLFIDKRTGRILSHSFNHGGDKTNTIKSRINALARHFGLEQVYQKNFVWYRGNEPF